VAYTYRSVEDLLENYAELKAKDIVPLRAGTPGSACLQRPSDLPVSPIRGVAMVALFFVNRSRWRALWIG
jgi:hypothetical protein